MSSAVHELTRTAPRPQLDVALVLELAQRLADRRAADADPSLSSSSGSREPAG